MVGGRGHLSIRSHEAARGDLRHRYAAADRERDPAPRLRDVATPTPTSWRVSGGCAATRSSTRWAGTTTGSRPSAAYRTTSACDATRRCPTTRVRRRRPRTRRTTTPCRSSRELHRALRAPDRRGREGVRIALPSPRAVGRLDAYVHDDRRVSRGVPRNAGSFGCSRAGSRTRPRRPRCGTSTSGPAVAQAEIEDREIDGVVPPGRVRSREGGGHVEIETSRPELIPACVAIVAHPDDERYRPLVGSTVLTPLFRVPVPVVPHELADPGEGNRRRADLHVRRRHRRDLVARARSADARRDPSRRHDRSRAGSASRAGSPATPRPRTPRWRSSPARRRSRPARGSSSCCARPAHLVGEPEPVRHVGEVLRERAIVRSR